MCECVFFIYFFQRKTILTVGPHDYGNNSHLNRQKKQEIYKKNETKY